MYSVTRACSQPESIAPGCDELEPIELVAIIIYSTVVVHAIRAVVTVRGRIKKLRGDNALLCIIWHDCVVLAIHRRSSSVLRLRHHWPTHFAIGELLCSSWQVPCLALEDVEHSVRYAHSVTTARSRVYMPIRHQYDTPMMNREWMTHQAQRDAESHHDDITIFCNNQLKACLT